MTEVYATATAGAATGTPVDPEFLDVFASPSPTRTPGVNFTCPEDTFDTNGLEPQWARVCRLCVEAVRGTPTASFGMALGQLPTLNLSTHTPVPTTFNTPTFTPTFTNTPISSPTPTATPTAAPFTDTWNLRLYDYVGVNAAFNGFWSSGQGWRQGATLTSDGSNNGYRLAVRLDLGYLIRTTAFSATLFSSGSPARAWTARGYTTIAGVDGAVSTSAAVTLFNTTGTLTGESVQTVGGNYMNPPTNGYYIRYIILETHSFTNNGGGWAEFTITGDKQYVIPTATPTFTVTPTITPTSLPTATPAWWATGYPEFWNVSVNCEEPEYIDMDAPLISSEIGRSESPPTCMTIVPSINIGFDVINDTAGRVFGFEIEPVILRSITVCFVGVSMAIQILGLALDMSIVVGAPILAFILRWVLFQ